MAVPRYKSRKENGPYSWMNHEGLLLQEIRDDTNYGSREFVFREEYPGAYGRGGSGGSIREMGYEYFNGNCTVNPVTNYVYSSSTSSASYNVTIAPPVRAPMVQRSHLDWLRGETDSVCALSRDLI